MKEGLVKELQTIEDFFLRSINCLKEEDSEFVPTEGTLVAAHQIAHVASTVDWFLDAMKSPEGFDMDFEKHWTDIQDCRSIAKAKEWFVNSMSRARELINSMSDAELAAPFPEGPVMGGAPRFAAISGISDHTAHHRGALTVYSRLIGHEPQMPYME